MVKHCGGARHPPLPRFVTEPTDIAALDITIELTGGCVSWRH
jgi:hypothetical protein